jgi:DMSO/TMAO reductase YedYZ molybdopterin-dependent catalytic subunit
MIDTPSQERSPRFLTDSDLFRDVSRGDPKPFTLKGDDLVKARLTPETWRLEIVGDGGAELQKPRKIEDGTAIDLPALEALGRSHGVKFLKAMQCLNISQPLGQGLWEGVPLREVIRLVGRIKNCRRIHYHGFHNENPKQLFQSSLSYTQALDTSPWDLGPFLAYRLNGEPLSLLRGGPVRMVVPWGYGFKSIKWLQRVTLTNEFKANDTYADGNNDPDSYLKTAAYLDDGQQAFEAGNEIRMHGTAMVGLPGLKRIEYWLRPDTGTHGELADDAPAWKEAHWQPCVIDPAPADWGVSLPKEVKPGEIWGFEPASGKPKEWPMRFSIATWHVILKDLAAGAYEFRVRTIDRNGFAQPEPRPYLKSGRNEMPSRVILVKG